LKIAVLFAFALSLVAVVLAIVALVARGSSSSSASSPSAPVANGVSQNELDALDALVGDTAALARLRENAERLRDALMLSKADISGLNDDLQTLDTQHAIASAQLQSLPGAVSAVRADQAVATADLNSVESNETSALDGVNEAQEALATLQSNITQAGLPPADLAVRLSAMELSFLQLKKGVDARLFQDKALQLDVCPASEVPLHNRFALRRRLAAGARLVTLNVEARFSLGTPEGDICHGLAVRGDAIYIVGTTNGSLHANVNAGSSDAFVARLDAYDGTIVWVQTLATAGPDRGRSIAVNSAGVFVTGSTTGALATNSTNNGTADVFLAHYSFGGQKLWVRQLGAMDEEDVGVGVAASETAVFLVGALQNSAFLARFTIGGDQTWLQRLTMVETAHAVALSNSGAVYIAGYATGRLGNGTHDVFVARLNVETGGYTWLRHLTSADADKGLAIAVGEDAEGTKAIFVTGATLNATQDAAGGAFLARLDADGETAWLARHGAGQSAGGLGVAVSKTGEVYITGQMIAADPAVGKWDAFVGRYTMQGERRAVHPFGTAGEDVGVALALAEDSSRLFVAVGTTGMLFALPTGSGEQNSDVFVGSFDLETPCQT
jgi:hypothetical protein